MKRDIILGMIAGLLALEFLHWKRLDAPAVPPGIYQASIDGPKYQEMLRTLDPPTVSSRETRAKLETRIENFTIDGRPLEWVIGYLADAAGVDILVDWSAFSNAEFVPAQPVKVVLHNVTVAQALRAVLDANGTADEARIVYEPARVRVTRADQAARDSFTRVYDVRDLVDAIMRGQYIFNRRPPVVPPFIQERHVAAPGSFSAGDFVPTPTEALESIARFLMEHVDPASWRDAGGATGSIAVVNGRMIIVQSRPSQDEVALTLEWIRKGLMP